MYLWSQFLEKIKVLKVKKKILKVLSSAASPSWGRALLFHSTCCPAVPSWTLLSHGGTGIRKLISEPQWERDEIEARSPCCCLEVPSEGQNMLRGRYGSPQRTRQEVGVSAQDKRVKCPNRWTECTNR